MANAIQHFLIVLLFLTVCVSDLLIGLYPNVLLPQFGFAQCCGAVVLFMAHVSACEKR